MCRYAFTNYPTSYVCVPDRHVAQYGGLFGDPEARCPKCQQPMVNVGRDFHAPRKRNDAGWAAVALVLASGKRYDSCGCTGPGYRPATPARARQDAVMARTVQRRRPADISPNG